MQGSSFYWYNLALVTSQYLLPLLAMTYSYTRFIVVLVMIGTRMMFGMMIMMMMIMKMMLIL